MPLTHPSLSTIGLTTLLCVIPKQGVASENTPLRERPTLRTPGLETCEGGPQDSTVATLDMDGAQPPLRPIPAPLHKSWDPSARRIVSQATADGQTFIDTRRPYGWTYTLIKEAGDGGAYALASDSTDDLCSPALQEARQLQFNMGHTLSTLWDVFGFNGWDNNGGALVGVIRTDDTGGATFHKEGPYVSFPSREGGLISYGRDLSVVAHEVAHAMEAHAGGPGSLRGDPMGVEAAALVESFADVFGVGIAQLESSGYQGQPDGDWHFGQDVGDEPFIRDLKTPGSHGGVDHIEDLLCEGDDTQIYLNTGITSKAFVHMVEGDEILGISPLDPSHQLSLSKAMALWIDVFTQDLSPEADFYEFEEALLNRGAEDPALYQTIKLALASVGLCQTTGISCTPDMIETSLSLPRPTGSGQIEETKLGDLVTRAAPADGDNAPDSLISYLFRKESSLGLYPLFLSGVDELPEFISPSEPSSPFDTPLCKGAYQPMALGDLTGDGQSEIILLTSGDSSTDPCQLRILKGGNPDQWESPLLQSHNLAIKSVTAGGDLSGDGIEDLVLHIGDEVAILPGWGDGEPPTLDSVDAFTFLPSHPEAPPSWLTPLEDMNGDGYGDIHVSFGEAPSMLYLSTSALAFSAPILLPPSPRAFALGDLDGDGLSDLALTNTQAPLGAEPTMEDERAGEVILLLGSHNQQELSTPNAHLKGETLHGRFGRYVTSHDLDGDGLKELFVTDSGAQPEYKQGRIQRFEWDGHTLTATGVLKGAGTRAFLGRGLVGVAGVGEETPPSLLVTAPGHRPSHSELPCKILDGGGVFTITAKDFANTP